MDNFREPSREELEAALEKAKRDYQEIIEKMTPEERAEAERKAAQAITEDEEKMQKLLDDCAKIMGKTAPAKKANFCSNCGAPAGEGNFCSYCGKPL